MSKLLCSVFIAPFHIFYYTFITLVYNEFIVICYYGISETLN